MPAAANTNEALQTVEVTAAQYSKGFSDNTIRKRALLKLLAQKGRITYNNQSHQFVWLEKFAQPTIQTHGSGGQFDFNQSDLYKQCSADVRGYTGTDVLYQKDFLMNGGGPNALIDHYGRKMPDLLEALDDAFGAELYGDGDDTSRDNNLQGLMTGMVYTSPGAADLIATPNGSYAGLTTNLGTYGGTWSSDLTTYPNATLAKDWPDGSGAVSYDFHAPLFVNSAATQWGSTTFADNCESVLRRTTHWLTKNGGEDGAPDVFMMGSNKWHDFCTYHSARYRISVPNVNGSTDLGFSRGALTQDGVKVMYEFDCPADKIHCINLDRMTLQSIDSTLWATRGPHYDIKTDAYLFRVGFFGNMIRTIKYFGLII